MKLHKEYKPHLDGLRGFAVLSVVAFHFWPELLNGGFVGVDIFFVISGYLISGIVLKELNGGCFSFRDFYERRIRRLFPALIVVTLAAGLFGWGVLFPSEFRNLGSHVMASGAFVSNLLCWRQKGYFEPSAESLPLLHLWSLGVEEQFYFAIPFVLFLSWRRAWLLRATVAGLFVLSLFLCVWASPRYPGAAFYLPVTRLWEPLLGVLLSLLEVSNAKGARGAGLPFGSLARDGKVASAGMADALFALGCFLLLGAAFLFSAADNYPGWRALLPTVGVALTIYGAGAGARCSVLSNAPLLWLGKISYPLYLWHWPLVSFCKILYPDSFSFSVCAALAGLALLLSWLTYRFVEVPVRYGSAFAGRKPRGLLGGIACCFLLGMLSQRGIVVTRFPPRAELMMEEALRDWEFPAVNNFHRKSGFETYILPGNSAESVLVLGDSHAEHYWSRFKYLLEKNPSARTVKFATYGGIPPLPLVVPSPPNFPDRPFFDYQWEQALQPDVKVVILSARWDAYFLPLAPNGGPVSPCHLASDPGAEPLGVGSGGFEKALGLLGDRIRELVGRGIEVVIVLPSAGSERFNPKYYVNRLTATTRNRVEMRMPKSAFSARYKPIVKELRKVAGKTGATVVDPLDYCCNPFCEGLDEAGNFIYRDDDHFRSSYVRTNIMFLDSFIKMN